VSTGANGDNEEEEGGSRLETRDTKSRSDRINRMDRIGIEPPRHDGAKGFVGIGI
jgi:hypothetical protein